MKAIVLEAKGKPMSIAEAEKGYLLQGLVEVEMKAAALNHRDLWITKGLYAGIKYPMVLGSDGAGMVKAVAKNLDASLIGKEVIINPSLNWGNDEACQSNDYRILGLPDYGTFSESVIVPVENILPMPAHLTFSQAAALPLAGLTAYRALFSRAQTRPGDKVLITGAGGGVAQFALQFALAIGCEVWVSSGSEAKIALAKALGASGGANYRQEGWAKQLKAAAGGFDVIIDGAAGKGFADLVELAANGGRIAIYGGTTGPIEAVSPQKIFWKQLSILGSTMGSPTDFHNMLRFVEDHKIVPVIDEVMPWQEFQSAFDKMEAGLQNGKLVLEF